MTNSYHDAMRQQTAAFTQALAMAHPELAPQPEPQPEPEPAPPPPPPFPSSLSELLAVVEREVRPPPGGMAKLIIKMVATKHDITVVQLIGQSRCAPIVRARQEACWTIRVETGMSLPQIGRMLGDRDHTTVLHGIKKHQQRLDRGGGMRIVVGIDPGIHGGVAVLNEHDRLETAHLPLVESAVIGNMIDCAALTRWISERDATEAIIERAHSFPGQGVASVFTYGMAFGQLVGVLQTLLLPIRFVEPQAWKKFYGLLNKKGQDKLPEDAPRQKARERFYLDDDTQFPLNKDIHRAEAALIADYALQQG